jgi:hypothetical protein
MDDGATNLHQSGLWQRAEFSWSSSASGGILSFTAGSFCSDVFITDFHFWSGVADAKGQIGQLKGTGLVLEAVNVPLPSSPSRVVLQQRAGEGEQEVRFVYKSGVVQVLSPHPSLFKCDGAS